MLFGAIDVGTNSIHLIVVEFEEGLASARVVYKAREMVRLGSGDARARGELDPQSIERGVAAIARFVDSARARGADHIRAVATSAVREASNAERFVRAVEQVTGVRVEVLGELDEARLIYEGVAGGFPIYDRVVCILDIGGGSTEFVTPAADGQPGLTALSVDIGCVRLTERHLHADPPEAAQVAAATADIDAALAAVAGAIPVSSARTLVGLAGSVTTLTAVALDLPAYDPARVHHAWISAERVHEVTDRLLRSGHAERAAIGAIHPGRVDVIGAGALILDRIMARFGFTEFVASEHDILDGIAWSIVRPGVLGDLGGSAGAR